MQQHGRDRDFVGYGRNPPIVQWPQDARVAVSFVVNYEEGAERSLPDGDPSSEAFGEIRYAMPEGTSALSEMY